MHRRRLVLGLLILVCLGPAPLIAGEIEATDGDPKALRRAYTQGAISFARQDMTFDLTDTQLVRAEVEVTVRAACGAEHLVVFGLGPVAVLSAEFGDPADRLLKTPGEFGHSGLVAVAFDDALQKDEERTFLLRFTYPQEALPPADGFLYPYPREAAFAYRVTFALPPRCIALCGPGHLAAHETTETGVRMTWACDEPGDPDMRVLARRLFHEQIGGRDYYLASNPASAAGAAAGLALMAKVYAFLEGLYGGRPPGSVVAFESDRESGTIMNHHGAIEMKKLDFEDPDDPWLAGALAHEFAHDWWGGVVHGHPDDLQVVTEALAELSSIHYGEKTSGLESAIEDVVINTMAYLDGDRAAVCETDDAVYSKVILVYRHLLGLVGEAAFFETARDVLKRHAGGQVSHRMFFDAAERRTGKDLDWLLAWLVHTDADLDFALTSVRWEVSGAEITTTIALAERVGRFDYPLPIPVEVETVSGNTHHLECVVGRKGAEITVTTSTPVHSISIDPRWVLWDIDRGNNFYGVHIAEAGDVDGEAHAWTETVGGFESRYRDGTWATVWVRRTARADAISFGGLVEELPTTRWTGDGGVLLIEFATETRAPLRALLLPTGMQVGPFLPGEPTTR